MLRLKTLALLAFPCLVFGLDNSVTHYNASGATQTNIPVTNFRCFAQGEIPNYPKPRGFTVWQWDEWNRWPDGTTRCGWSSFRQTIATDSSATVDWINNTDRSSAGNDSATTAAGLSEAGMLAHNGSDWGCKIEATVNSIVKTASARTIVDAADFTYILRGPVVTRVVARNVTSSLTHNFGWQWDGDSWENPGANVQYNSLIPSFELSFYPDPDGAGSLTAWPGVECDAILDNTTTTRLQLIPIAQMRILTGGAETTQSYIDSTTRNHHARRRWHKLLWSGSNPGATLVDHNFNYLIRTRIIGPFDNSLAVTSTLADTHISTYGSRMGSDDTQFPVTNTTYAALWTKGVGATAGRPEIALTTGFQLAYLYAMGRPATFTLAKRKEIWDKLIVGCAEACTSAPIHFTETNATYNTTPFTNESGFASDYAVGRVVSIDARPTFVYGLDGEGTSTAVCTAAPCDGRAAASASPYRGGWTYYGTTSGTSHQPNCYFIPALLTGRWYWITSAQMQATYGTAASSVDSRYNSMGVAVPSNSGRSFAWVNREYMTGYFMSQGSSPEAAYFRDKLKNNAASGEGIYNIQTGAHFPGNADCANYNSSSYTYAQMWWRGHCSARWDRSPLTYAGGANPIAMWTINHVTTGPSGQNEGIMPNTPYDQSYFWSYIYQSWGWISQTGAILDDDGLPMGHYVAKKLAQQLAGRLLSDQPFLVSMYSIPQGPPVGETPIVCETWDCVKNGYAWNVGWVLDSNIDATQTTNIDVAAGAAPVIWWDVSMVDCFLKVGSEWMRLSNGTKNSPSAGKGRFTLHSGTGQGRGQWGTAATSHTAGETVYLYLRWVATTDQTGGYGVHALAGTAALANAPYDLTAGDLSLARAWDVIRGSMPNQNTQAANPQNALIPRPEITNVRRDGDILMFTAPNGAACSWANNPTSSLDSADSVIPAGPRYREINGVTGLTGVIRITCGTARTEFVL